MSSPTERVVLIAMDGSEASHFAFETYVKGLWKKGDLVVLFTCKELKEVLDSFWKESVFDYDPELLKDSLGKEQAEVSSFMKPCVAKLNELGLMHKNSFIVGKHAGHMIIETAMKEGALLIIMGSRGHGAVRRTFMGACSDYVVNHSNIPVLICKRH